MNRLHQPELADLLTESRASAAFKSDIARYLESGAAERVSIRGYAPRIKITRLLTQLFAEHGDLEIEYLRVNGQSGCSDFAGTVEVVTKSGSKTIEFHWCCRWRAEEQGWTDYFGFPDQMRAAREYDWRCFRVWREQ